MKSRPTADPIKFRVHFAGGAFHDCHAVDPADARAQATAAKPDLLITKIKIWKEPGQ